MSKREVGVKGMTDETERGETRNWQLALGPRAAAASHRKERKLLVARIHISVNARGERERENVTNRKISGKSPLSSRIMSSRQARL